MLFLIAKNTFPKDVIGLKLGGGIATDYTRNITPAFGFEYLHKIRKHISVGLVSSFERFSIQQPNGIYPIEKINIDIKCNYLYIAPKLDINFGKKQLLHIFFTYGPDVYLSGSQNSIIDGWVHINSNGYGGQSYQYYDTFRSSKNITKNIMQMGVGVQENIPLNNKFCLIAAQEYRLLANKIASYSSPIYGNTNYLINTNYFSFQIGVIYCLPAITKRHRTKKIEEQFRGNEK